MGVGKILNWPRVGWLDEAGFFPSNDALMKEQFIANGNERSCLVWFIYLMTYQLSWFI